MADISKFVPNGNEYNLKDAVARENIGNLTNLETTNKGNLVEAINEVNGNAGTNVKASIADDYSTSVNYAVGDFCYHLGTLYKCTTAHTAGAWNAAHFTATQVGDEIGELKNTLSGYTYHTISASDITERNSSISSIAVSYVRWGKLCILYLGYTVTANINAWTKLFKIPIDGVIPEINPSYGPLEYMGVSGAVMSNSTISAGEHYDQIVYICK